MWRHPQKVDCPNHREMMYHTRRQKPWTSWVLLTFHGSTGGEGRSLWDFYRIHCSFP